MKLKKLEYINNLILDVLIILIGIFIMSFPIYELLDPTMCVGIIFYVYAFINVILYFIHRKEGDYELLFDALIGVIVGSLMFMVKTITVPFMLGTGFLIFSLLTILNKSYYIHISKETSSKFVSFVVVFLIGFLGILTVINLYKELTVSALMIGYYFITFGAIRIMKPLLFTFISPKKLDKLLDKILNEDEKEIKKTSNKNKK